MTNEVQQLIADWFRRSRESQMVHYEYASLLERRHLLFGIPAIALSTLVGTAVFSAWEADETGSAVRVILGLLSITAATVTALQTFLNLSERAARHKISGAGYGAARRDLELLKTLPPEDPTALHEALQTIKQKMDELAASAPSVPSKFKQKVDNRLKSKMHKRIIDLTPTPPPPAP